MSLDNKYLFLLGSVIVFDYVLILYLIFLKYLRILIVHSHLRRTGVDVFPQLLSLFNSNFQFCVCGQGSSLDFIQGQLYQPGLILSPPKYLAMSKDIFGGHKWGYYCVTRVETRDTGKHPTVQRKLPHRSIQPKISTVPLLRNPALGCKGRKYRQADHSPWCQIWNTFLWGANIWSLSLPRAECSLSLEDKLPVLL